MIIVIVLEIYVALSQVVFNWLNFACGRTCKLSSPRRRAYRNARRRKVASHEVPSPGHVSKSQHGGKVPTFESQFIIKIWLIINEFGPWLIYVKTFTGLVLRVGSNFLHDPTLNTSPKSKVQKVLPCRYSYHTRDLRYMGVIWLLFFHVLQLQPSRFAQQDSFCIKPDWKLANLWQNICTIGPPLH
jgi:hypothetical protein